MITTTLYLFSIALMGANPPEDYDNFEGSRWVSGDLWRGAEAFSTMALPYDMTRIVQKGQLRLVSQAHARAEGGLVFKNPHPVTRISAAVQIEKMRSEECALRLRGEPIHLALGGRWFRSTAPSAGASGDIAAAVELLPSSSALTARCRVYRCLNADCSSTRDLGSQSLGTIEEEETTDLSIIWEPLLDRFSCAAGDSSGLVSYTAADDLLAASPIKGVLAEHPACGAQAVRSTIEAFVDDVVVNAGARASNDTCDRPQRIDRAGTYYAGTAGFIDDYAGSCAPSAGADAVFELVLARATKVVISTLGSSFDTVLYVTDSCGSGRQELACNDDTRRGLTSELRLELQAGTYQIVVDGHGPTSSGDVTLVVSYR